MKVYLVVENPHCHPGEPYTIIAAHTNFKKAMLHTGRDYPTRWVKIISTIKYQKDE